MFVFKSKIKNTYIATNPKVLTRTLYAQENLERYISKKRYLHFLLNKFSLGPEYILLARNPYKRVESYFKEKLRQKVKLVLQDENPYQLKRHQEIFYPYIGVNTTDTDEEKVDKILALSFSDFIKIIPLVYRKEDHLNLQTDNFERKVLRFDLSPKFSNIVQIENSSELEHLFNRLQLDVTVKSNASSDIKENLDWDDNSIKIVNEIYNQDFVKLGYKKW